MSTVYYQIDGASMGSAFAFVLSLTFLVYNTNIWLESYQETDIFKEES